MRRILLALVVLLLSLGTAPAAHAEPATYVPSHKPHEMFLWTDPRNPSRELLYLSTPTVSVDPNRPNLIVTDVSRAREGAFTEIASGNRNHLYPGAENPANYDNDLAVHSTLGDAARLDRRGAA